MSKKKRGRPRKEGIPRYENGRAKPITVAERRNAEGGTPTQWQRMRTWGKQVFDDKRWESELLRLHHFRILTDRQCGTASKIAHIYARHECTHGKRRSAKSPDYEMGMVRGEISGSDREFFDKKFTALRDFMRFRLRGAIEQLCVEGQPINPTDIRLVADELDRIAEFHFGWKSRQAKVAPPDKLEHSAALARALQDRASYRLEPSVRGDGSRRIAA